ncbi:hypothetical protein KDU71_10685 [Carboxylicivirga sediminis]|uniref:Uncharacterized protein n=1 Tax=Carboxylicivirga sediminis TaxID=2006564 RepID=A0A941IXG3_9BACT|nr:hypothetical protein [Carboxylicivirga sediminis]MBR8536025.1 hypothetical protein [Carboxylicivirga sediminis]
MKKIFFYMAALGLVLGLIVHVISLLGIYIGDTVPYVWALHAGVFVVWLPAILTLKKHPELQQKGFKPNMTPKQFYGILFKSTPPAVVAISAFFFVYMAINFILFMQASMAGTPDIIDGKYVLHNHGEIIRELTEAEYFKMEANTIRGFSGHWMAFYAVAMCILWPGKESEGVRADAQGKA